VSVAVITKIRAKAGAQRQLEQAIRALIAGIREKAEAGAPQYTLYRCLEDPAMLTLWECYAGPSAPEIDDGAGGLIDELTGLIDGRPILETLIEVED
jgi:hypothetical protein